MSCWRKGSGGCCSRDKKLSEKGEFEGATPQEKSFPHVHCHVCGANKGAGGPALHIKGGIADESTAENTCGFKGDGSIAGRILDDHHTHTQRFPRPIQFNDDARRAAADPARVWCR